MRTVWREKARSQIDVGVWKGGGEERGVIGWEEKFGDGLTIEKKKSQIYGDCITRCTCVYYVCECVNYSYFLRYRPTPPEIFDQLKPCHFASCS